MTRTSMLVGLSALALAACGGGGDTTPTTPVQATVATVDVSPSGGTLVIPNTLQLTATPRDAQGAAVSGRAITWSSSASSIASVNTSGLVTAVSAGTATITASVDGKQGLATITVAPAVASVDITPPGGNINLPGTLQLTATPRDAQGANVGGRTIAWTSSAVTIATVSSSGLVTAVAAGSTVITASVDGRQAQATVTVTASDYGPVVARSDVGTSGGTVATTDIGVTIPAGALTSTNTITLARDTVTSTKFTGNSASSMYVLDGIPEGQLVQTRVRIKYTGTNTGAAAIAVQRPAMESAEELGVVMGTTLVPATDSSGYLVATIPLRGKPAAWTSTGMLRATPSSLKGSALVSAEVDPRELKAAAELTGLINLTRATSSAGHFDVWGFGGGADLQAKVMKAASVAEAGLTQITSMGFSTAHRTAWPIEVYVVGMTSGYGSWTSILPFPVDPNQGYISYNTQYINDADFPGTVIHEIFHMVQGGFMLGKDWSVVGPTRWLNEASSTWMMELHPQSGSPYAAPIALSWRDSMFTGLAGGMVAKSGYGKAPIVKYIAKRWGSAKVKEIYTLMSQGAASIPALMIALPEQPDLWWPDALNQHMGGSLYGWSVRELVPRHTYNLSLDAGDQPFATDALAALGVEGEMLVRDTAKFGPNFVLPISLSAPFFGQAKILAYQKTAAAAMFRPMSAGDTVKIPGNVLQRKDSVLLLITPVKPVSPYTAKYRVAFHVDLSVPDGDWRFPTVTNIVDGNRFVCDQPHETVSLDVGENASSVWDYLAQLGTWKQTATTPGTATFTWQPDPGNQDSLTKYGIVMQSTLTQGLADTIRARATLKMGATAIREGGFGTPSSNSSPSNWWLLLVPLSVVPFALTKKSRRAMPVVATATLVLLVSCGVGQISFAIDETLDYTFTKMRFMTDPAKPNDPLMQLDNGSGTTTLKSYRSEYWAYSYAANGDKADSTRTVCTGSGASTYKVSGLEYAQGVKPPTASVRFDFSTATARAFGRNPATLPRGVQGVRR